VHSQARLPDDCVAIVRVLTEFAYTMYVHCTPSLNNTNCRYLATGGTDCTVRVYDLYTGAVATELSGQPDAVGGVSFSPAAPLLALCTGQRHFKQVRD
jgi:WD40 repeat protein